MKNLFNHIDQVYRQNPEKFDRLTSLLITQIDDPNVLFFKTPQEVWKGNVKLNEKSDTEWESVDANDGNIDESESAGSNSYDDQKNLEIETKFFKDAVQRVREDFLKARLKTISHELKVNATPEKIEEMMAIQKSLKDLKDSKES